MPDFVDHAPDLGRVVVLHAVSDVAKAKRAQRVPLALIGAVLGAALRHLEVAHGEDSPDASAGDPESSVAVAEDAPPLPARPRTWLIESPRSSATSSGVRNDSSPVIVALTRLMGFWDPRLFDSTSRMPASSSTARTPPPAITPVPSLAGRRKTFAASKRPRISCVIVVPCFGTVNRFFFASSTAFVIARGTSRALP